MGWGHLAGPVPTGGAVGDAMHCQVEVMEDDFLALDAQFPDTAWGTDKQDEQMWGAGMPARSNPAPLLCPPRLPQALPDSQVRLGRGWR